MMVAIVQGTIEPSHRNPSWGKLRQLRWSDAA
jgi:hypothetical protein